MDLWHSLGGMVRIQLVSADCEGAMLAFMEKGVTVFDSLRTDALTLCFSVKRQDVRKVRNVARKRGEQVKFLTRSGLYWTGKGLLKRPILLFGVLFLIFLACFIPSRVLFIRIEGNVRVPTNYILEKAAESGISFGASRREVRNEKMKNALLEAVPQLQWAGVNTNGCVATITVRERQEVPTSQIKTGVSSFVAACDGVIESCTATKGNLLCKPGQAVKAGQTLISGYTDCGLSIRVSRAEGEVFARTQRNVTAVTPSSVGKKGESTKIVKKYSMIIGKKLINFSKDSGILDTTCDKMYVENFVTLPGGFRLPISFVTEIWIQRQVTEEAVSQEHAETQLSQFATGQLQKAMIAGEILEREEAVSSEIDYYSLSGSYACREMIGREQEEEIVAPYGKHDGT